jgi:beta-N-acetylhexosaminidase
MLNNENLTAMPIEKRIGQLFFIGLDGPELDSQTSKLLDEINPGGICLFARNVRSRKQVRRFLDEIREKLEIEPFLSLDQEGGLVDRLRRISTPIASAGSITSVADANRLAEITAEIILTLGFNMNFAPVVDVIDERRREYSNGLHSRAFGKSKDDVIALAGAYLKTLQKSGCVGSLKHFPGLGGAEKDAHDELPIVNITKSELFATDLAPYIELFATYQVQAVMVAHAAFPNLDLQETDRDGKLLPSTLSFNFITKLLREELNFDNLVITDDLEMGAVINNYGVGEACKMAIQAGADLLAICAKAQSVRDGFHSVVSAVNSGEISESRIDQSIQRIARVKSNLATPLAFSETRLEALSQETADFNRNISYRYGG